MYLALFRSENAYQINRTEPRGASFLVRMGQKVKDLHGCTTLLSYLIAPEEEQLLNMTSFPGGFLTSGQRVQKAALAKSQRLAGGLGCDQPP